MLFNYHTFLRNRIIVPGLASFMHLNTIVVSQSVVFMRAQFPFHKKSKDSHENRGIIGESACTTSG